MRAEKKRILVVDDEPPITRLLRINLENTNQYVVRTENDPEAVLAAALEFLPDLILLDVVMPGMGGDFVKSRLLECPKLKGVPIVFLTAAVTRPEVYDRNGSIGGEEFLAKPVDVEEIVSCLRRHLP